MSQIPDDIMRTAEATLDKLLCNCAESCGGLAGMRSASIKDIAMAIAAEREACADVADKYGDVEIRDAINLRDS